MLLIFLILVMLAAERRAEMGMSRAVGMKRRQLIEAFIRQKAWPTASLSTAFFLLYRGLPRDRPLAVGIALAVIAPRTVVERRQQIRLMRAIGFTRANVALSFVLESAFEAVPGIANGIWRLCSLPIACWQVRISRQRALRRFTCPGSRSR
jgi:hypothetical protein